MFEALTEKFEAIVKQLRGHGKITSRNIEVALREVRVALLEADVHFRVVKDFIEAVSAKALGKEVLASLTPEQHFIKIVHEELTRLMGRQAVNLPLSFPPPVILMLVGLQGSGKTTTAAKLARFLKEERGRTPVLVAADVRRPAAAEQLEILGGEIGCAVYSSRSCGPLPPQGNGIDIARQALATAERQGWDVAVLDTAGRWHIDDDLMRELEKMKEALHPHQTVLVADAMTGQDAVSVAEGFHRRLRLDGVILTKMEGDARGGAAVSIRAVTGAPILFVGVGEKPEALESFHPERMASRISGMGDILSLIEKAEKAYDTRRAEIVEKKLRKNEFSLEDFRDQLRAVRRMGSVAELLSLIPGAKKFTRQVNLAAADGELKKIEAIIDSMTKEERYTPTILNGSRRLRIARGSGTSVAEVNRFLKQYTQTKKILKQVSKMGP